MESLATPTFLSTAGLFFSPSSNPNFSHHKSVNFNRLSRNPTVIRASSNPISKSLKTAAASAVVLTAILSASAKLRPAWAAEPAVFPTTAAAIEEKADETTASLEAKSGSTSPLSQFLDSDNEAVDLLRSLLYQKLEDGEDTEALKILRKLISSQPTENEWKFLAARVLSENGELSEARQILEEILAADPLSFEALFENAVLMDRSGQGPAVIERLERALDLAKSEQNDRAARDVRLIMAQIQFLQRNVDEALTSYEGLANEDPKDYRPYFCQGVIYSLMDRNKEAREMFAKYQELAPRKFDVDAYLQSPLSRVKLT